MGKSIEVSIKVPGMKKEEVDDPRQLFKAAGMNLGEDAPIQVEDTPEGVKLTAHLVTANGD